MTTHKHGDLEHTHESDSGHFSAKAKDILIQGISELLKLTENLEKFGVFPSERYPLPLSLAVYGSVPAVKQVRKDIYELLETDPVSILERVLVLVELFESNTPESEKEEYFSTDKDFLTRVFMTKRHNGWTALLGGCEKTRKEAREEVNKNLQFDFVPVPLTYRPTGVYYLLETLARHGFVYGRMKPGDAHALGHFIEEFSPGVLICLPGMSAVELTLSLAAMKLGVPAVVPKEYPFSYGRFLKADGLKEIAKVITGFPNTRKLLELPDVPKFPDYCVEVNKDSKPSKGKITYGSAEGSFYLFKKSAALNPGVNIIGKLPRDPQESVLGILVEAKAEPLDALDRDYIEKLILKSIPLIPGYTTGYANGALLINVEIGIEFMPERVAEVLKTALTREFPKIKEVSVSIYLDGAEIKKKGMFDLAKEEKAKREEEIKAYSEESCPSFYGCVGCSPFAPDHVCILTVERTPQCNRPFATIKTGAHYGYDDMTNIHHRVIHESINSFRVVEKGKCLDPLKGEWEGSNKEAIRLTGGRTKRILLHTLKEAPTTGCGCFGFILFETDKPKKGIGIMSRGFKGAAADGRTWRDLHYALGGKQAPGLSGCSAGYILSKKFLQADGGWKNVVWITEKIANIAAGKFGKEVEIGKDTE